MVGINNLNGIVDIGRDTFDERDLVFDGDGVGYNQGFGVVSAGAYAVDGAAASFDPNEIVAEIVEMLLDAGLAGLPDGDDADDGGNADGDTEDGQDAAQFVAKQCDQGGAE